MFTAPGEWEKVLWKSQAFPDNYIPPRSFLSSLRKNPNFRPYSYWPLVLLSCAITQHLATIFIFLAIFVRLKEHSLDPRILVWISVGCFLAGYVTWELLDFTSSSGVHRHANRVKTLKSSILIFLALMSLSPVLRTLTAATSSDSIWALSAILFILNALLGDYSSRKFVGQVRETLTSVLSMNAAISSSVVLASRLSNDLAVFSLILFSVQTFALFPMLRHRVESDPTPTILQPTLTVLLSILSILLTASLSWTITYVHSTLLIFVTFLAPAVLVWAQKYKNEIRGPWDVAVPKVN